MLVIIFSIEMTQETGSLIILRNDALYNMFPAKKYLYALIKVNGMIWGRATHVEMGMYRILAARPERKRQGEVW